MSDRRRWGNRTKRPVNIDRHPDTGERVHYLTAPQLHQRLVKDALRGYPEGRPESESALYLMWSVEAVKRIAAVDRIGIDAAYVRVRQEVASLGGTMPTAPGS